MRPQSSKRPNNNQNMNLSQIRPKSAKEKQISNFSKPTTSKNSSRIIENNQKSKVMPKKIEKEQLYEDSVLLKISINKLRKELDQAKSSIVQKDLEIKKKNKIIEDCTRDNDIDFVHKENIEKGKETTSITLCKKKYYETKKLFKKKSEENDILKAHIKITKIKDLERENQRLEKEMGKIKDLYLNSQFAIENGNKEIDNLLEIKNKFVEQHILLNSLKKNCEQLNQENSELKKQLNKINEIKEKNMKEKKKLKTINMKLKFNNEKFLIERKQTENSTMNKGNYERQIKELNEKLDQFKNDYNQKTKLIDELNRDMLKKNKNEVNVKVLNSQELKEEIFPEKENKKLEFIKNLLKDAQFKIDIYEKYLTDNNFNTSKILRKYKYNNGLMNSNSPPLQLTMNFNSHLQYKNSPKKKKEEVIKNDNLILTNENDIYKESYLNQKKNDNNNNEKIEDIEEKYEEEKKKENQETNNDNNNNKKEEESDGIVKIDDRFKNEENINLLNQNNEENEEELSQDFLTKNKASIPHILLINLESNHLTKDKLINLSKEILENLGKMGDEISKDDFIEPYKQLFIDNLKITKKNDIQIINFYLDDLLESNENDTEKFQANLNEIFNSIVDYSSINEEEMNNKLKNELLKYPNLLNKLKEKDIHKNEIISYIDFKNIYSDIDLKINDDSIEYLFYKMKINVPKNHSILDLNYKFIEDLIKKDDSNKIIEEKENSSSIDLDNVLKSTVTNNIISEKIQNNNDDNKNLISEKIKSDIDDNNNVKQDNDDDEENYDDFVMDNAQINEN